MTIATLAIFGVITPLKINSDICKANECPASLLDVLDQNPTSENIKRAVVYIAEEYGIDESQLLSTIQCESGFRHTGVYGDSGLAYGVAQFHKPTFDGFCEGNYYSAKDQLVCLAKMWNDSRQSHWSCYNKLVAKK